MTHDLQPLADRFRFVGWDKLTDEERETLEENALAVAELLPRSHGLALFDILNLKVPPGYVGKPDPVGTEGWKARAAWKRSQGAE